MKRGQINPQFGMTDAAFFGKIRAALRRIWTSSQAHKDAINRAKIPFADGRRKYKVRCPSCSNLYNLGEKIQIETSKKGKYKSKSIYHVDHIDECGTLKSFADMGPFTERLFTGRQELLCHYCHERKHAIST